MQLKQSHSYIILTIFTFLLFANTLNNEFVFDDESVVQNNTAIQNLSNIPKFFTAEEGFHKVIGRYYRPVVFTTYAIDYAIWGLKPFGFHLTNILIHIIACLLILKILFELFGKYKYGKIFSLISAMIFAAHPIHTEAVSWISGRTDSLSTLFIFASLLYYIIYSKSKSEMKYLIYSLAYFALALLSKEMAVTFPVIILLYDFVYRKERKEYFLKNIKAYIYFIAVTIIFLLIRYFALKDVVERTNYLYFAGKDVVTIIATMIKTIPVYFKLLVVPVNLIYHYNGIIPDSDSLADLNVLSAIFFIVLLIAASFLLYKKHNVVSFAVLFFLASLLPVMNIVPTMNLMAERFLYISSFAIIIVIAYYTSKFVTEKNEVFIIVISALIIIVFSYMTYYRNAEWKTNDTLYKTGEGLDGTVLLVNAGNIYANNKQYDEAEKKYKRAIEIRDNSLLAHHNLGLIYLLRGSLDSAEIKFKKSISIDSLAPDGYFQLASLYRMQGRTPEAIDNLEKLQKIIPDYRESANLLVQMKAGTDNTQTLPEGDLSDMKYKDTKLNILNQRSFNYYQQKKYKEAINDLRELIQLNPEGKSGYLNNIALCYDAENLLDKAEEAYLDALKTDGKNISSLFGISDVYKKKGNKELAKSYLKKILEINPGDANAVSKLDSLK